MIKIKIKSGVSDSLLRFVDSEKSLLFFKIVTDPSDVYYIVIDKVLRSTKEIVSVLSGLDFIDLILLDDKNPSEVLANLGLCDIIVS